MASVAYARNAIRAIWMYRADLIVSMVNQALTVILLMVVWRAAYSGNFSVSGVSQSEAVNYAILASCLQTALMPWDFSSLNDRVRRGQVGIDVIRPFNLVNQCLAQNVGTLLARLPITVVGLIVGSLVGAFDRGPRLQTATLFVVSLLLGMTLVVLMNLLMSFASFWSLEIGGYMMLYRLASGLASGALIPLWFMPNWLAGILYWLPFQAQMFAPLSIYFGRSDGGDAWAIIVTQVVWLILMCALIWFVYRRAMYKLVVLGG